MGTLDGKRIAFLATDGVEQIELTEPLKAVREAGAEVDLISLEKGEFQGFNHLDKGDTFTADKAVADADADDYDGLVAPGRRRQPRHPAHGRRRHGLRPRLLRRAASRSARSATRRGSWSRPASSRSRTVTSWPSLQTDLRNAGANWVDEEVVVDEGLVTSRKPDDLPAFCAKIVEEFAEGRHEDAPQPASSAAS